MANLKSSKKDIKRSTVARIKNTSAKSAIKTFIKKAKKASTGSDAAAMTTATITAIKAIDKAAQKGIIHKNQAARRKSRLAKAIKKTASN